MCTLTCAVCGVDKDYDENQVFSCEPCAHRQQMRCACGRVMPYGYELCQVCELVLSTSQGI